MRRVGAGLAGLWMPVTGAGKLVWLAGVLVLVVETHLVQPRWWIAFAAGIVWAIVVGRYDTQRLIAREEGR